MIKATTEHGTYYLIDMKNLTAKRVPAADRGELLSDNQWFHFVGLTSFDRETQEHSLDPLELGKSLYFMMSTREQYDWRISTDIVSIEEVEE
jgi:hypothetical protein